MNKTFLLLLAFTLLLFANVCFGTDQFHTLSLTSGVTIEIPKHWLILDKISDSDIQTAGQAAAEKAGFTRSGEKINLLRANSDAKFADGTIAINYYPDSNATSMAVAELSDAEVAEVAKMWYLGEEKVMNQIAPSVKLSSFSFERKMLGAHPVISFSYVRPTIGSDPDKSGFKVTFSRLFINTGFISVVQSYRVGKELLYQLVMDRILNSLVIPSEL